MATTAASRGVKTLDGIVAAASSGWGGELLWVAVVEDVVDAVMSVL